MGMDNLEISKGKQAQRHNILAARALGETIRTTLGPKGMDKMIVGSDGIVTITNDGATILAAMDIPHPTAKMIAESAKTQESEVGDGTTTVVVLASELLKRAEELLDQGMHPTVIIKGYKLATKKAAEVLNNLAKGFKDKNKVMRDIAITAMTGKGVEEDKEVFAKICVEASLATETKRKNIKIIPIPGGAISDSSLITGVVLEKIPVRESMPRIIKNARIALINSPIEPKETDVESKITISSPEQMERFVMAEESMLNNLIERILASGANCIFCEKGIDDAAQHSFESAGVMALRRVRHADMKLLEKSTGAKIVTDIMGIKKEDTGRSKEVKIDEETTIVKGDGPVATILLRGGTNQVILEVERAIEDALGDIAAVIEVGKVLGGAGSPEIELNKQITDYAARVKGKEQLAVLAYAKAMEIIPVTLAENAGLDPIDVLAKLKNAHGKDKYAGIDVEIGEVVNTLTKGIVEPLKVKTQAVSSALEVATMILRIDDIIVNEQKRSQEVPFG